MPPVLNISFQKLAGRAQKQVLAHTMVRPAKMASLLSFHRILEQASARRIGTNTKVSAANVAQSARLILPHFILTHLSVTVLIAVICGLCAGSLK
jgi:hypothetical protein